VVGWVELLVEGVVGLRACVPALRVVPVRDGVLARGAVPARAAVLARGVVLFVLVLAIAFRFSGAI
jgi:hypothetical protein